MTVPAPNTTCDVYRSGNSPPAAPDVAGVSIQLRTDWRGGQEAGERNTNVKSWTHIALLPTGTDVRDGFTGAGAPASPDTVWVPDKDGQEFDVTFVEPVHAGRRSHLRVYLDRQQADPPIDH